MKDFVIKRGGICAAPCVGELCSEGRRCVLSDTKHCRHFSYFRLSYFNAA